MLPLVTAMSPLRHVDRTNITAAVPPSSALRRIGRREREPQTEFPRLIVGILILTENPLCVNPSYSVEVNVGND